MMEVVKENLIEQELISLENLQLKIENKIALPENAKKLFSVSCQLLGQNIQVADNEITLTGSIVTRLIFINEFEKFDSQDFTDTFEKKIVIKDVDPKQVFVTGKLLDSQWELQENQVVLNNILSVEVKTMKSHEIQIVSDLTGDVEVRKNEYKVLSFNSVVQEKFEIIESLELDSACEGVLGVDVNPYLKDVAVNNAKVNLKGVVTVNLLSIKTVDNTAVPYNTTHEVDFSKSISLAGLTNEDLACGAVMVDMVEMHVENNAKGSVLVLKLNLIYHGSVYGNHVFNNVVDAISFDKELVFQTAETNCVDVLPQVNTTVEIENNINLAPNTPYITHVLTVDGARVNDLQVSAADGKILLEGILAVNMLIENEEHMITGEHYKIPFQTHVRMDNLDRDYTVQVSAIPLVVHAKARRGVELLVDAQLGVVIQASTQKQISIVNNLEEGANKVDDGSAIRIYIIGEKENLWNLAKRTNLSCASLVQQNPNLKNGCTPGERIVVYRHENVSL